MRSPLLLLLLLLATLLSLTTSFNFLPPTSAVHATTSLITPTTLAACRTNAKKEKRLRNRENMKQFATKKRGTSRKRLIKKVASTNARIAEAEFVAMLFKHEEGPTEPEIREFTPRR